MTVEGDPDRLEFDRQKMLFGNDEVVTIAIPFEDPFAPDSLIALRDLSGRLSALPFVEEVDSLTTTNDILGRGGALEATPLVGDSGVSRLVSERVRERVRTNDLWRGLLVSEDLSTVAIHVRLKDLDSVELRNAVPRIREIADQQVGAGGYYVAGHPFMKHAIAETTRRDLLRLLPLSLAVMAACLVVVTGSVHLAVILLGSVLISVAWMVGLMGWTGQPLTVLSNTCPTILLALGTAYFMHLASSYQREISGACSRSEASQRAIDMVGRPTLIAGVTTAIGIGSLGLSDVPLIAGFGFDLSMGVIAVVVVGYFGLPAALSLAGPRVASGSLPGEPWLEIGLFRLTGLARNRRREIAVCVALIGCGTLILGSRLEISSSGPGAFSEEAEFRRFSSLYQDKFGGDVLENVYFQAVSNFDFQDPEYLTRLRRFQREAERLPAVGKTLSIADYVARMNRAIHEEDPEEERIPDTREAVAQYFLLYSLSADLSDFKELVNTDYREARVMVTATVPSSRESMKLRQDLSRLAEATFPSADTVHSVLSTEILLSSAADRLAGEQLRGFVGVLIVILAVVMVAFRSPAVAGHLLLPNLLPIGLYLGFMAVSGLSLSQSTVVIAVVSLGIAVDSSVHLIASVERARAIHGSREASVVFGMLRTGRPVVLTTSVVCLGFGMLTFSEFRLVSEFGGLTALTMAFCLVSDLVVLPAQLLAFRSRSSRRTREAQETGLEWLLVAGRSAVPAGLLWYRGEEASFRLVGEESRWRDWRGRDVR